MGLTWISKAYRGLIVSSDNPTKIASWSIGNWDSIGTEAIRTVNLILALIITDTPYGLSLKPSWWLSISSNDWIFHNYRSQIQNHILLDSTYPTSASLWLWQNIRRMTGHVIILCNDIVTHEIYKLHMIMCIMISIYPFFFNEIIQSIRRLKPRTYD